MLVASSDRKCGLAACCSAASISGCLVIGLWEFPLMKLATISHKGFALVGYGCQYGIFHNPLVVAASAPLLHQLWWLIINGSRGLGTTLPDYDGWCPKRLPWWLRDLQRYEHHLPVKVGATNLQAAHNNRGNAPCNCRQLTTGPPLANWVVSACTSHTISTTVNLITSGRL